MQQVNELDSKLNEGEDENVMVKARVIESSLKVSIIGS
jgi:hypothetical protein